MELKRQIENLRLVFIRQNFWYDYKYLNDVELERLKESCWEWIKQKILDVKIDELYGVLETGGADVENYITSRITALKQKKA